MKSPDVAAISDSLEHSFRSFSLNHRLASASGAAVAAPSAAVVRRSSPSSSSSDEDDEQRHSHRFDTTLELNSHISLPPFWEQCLDLKTGEVYYRNCRTGMRVKEDPRTTTTTTTTVEANSHRDLYSEDDDDDDADDESSSDGGSEESCSTSPSYGGSRRQQYAAGNEEVLVVAGCKRCFMYFMVPKQVEDCPKCSSSRLVHFDRSDENGFP